MIKPRIFHTSTLLPDGRVLIAGGLSSCCTALRAEASAELYDPSTGTFTATGSMTTPRALHTATLLPDGKVLIAGGGPMIEGRLYPLASAELYDPATGTFAATGSMLENIFSPATLLYNGKVLIVGGTSAELYDPSTGTFSLTGSMIRPYADTATLLSDGKVLITRSNPDGTSQEDYSAEVYDPATGIFASAGYLNQNHTGPTAVLLTNGSVLVAGGDIGDGDGCSFDAELFDPATGVFGTTSDMTHGREAHTATLLPDGTALFAGGGAFGKNSGYEPESAELYDPGTNAFRITGSMSTGRLLHVATLLNDGTVLVTGGYDVWGEPFLASAEIYIPAVLVPVLIVTDLQFDRTNVVGGFSYSTTVSGSNLAPDTFFDVRFLGPGSSESAVVLNWQKGLDQRHDVPAGIASGDWTINGVRAHRVETDHTGSFASVSATITVGP
jgi:hypothetical protein